MLSSKCTYKYRAARAKAEAARLRPNMYKKCSKIPATRLPAKPDILIAGAITMEKTKYR